MYILKCYCPGVISFLFIILSTINYLIKEWYDKKILTKLEKPKLVIAVTGSSGKGSTSKIVTHVLRDNGYDFIDNKLQLGQFPFSLKGSLLMPAEKIIFDLTISSDKNEMKHIPAIVPEMYQEWAKDIQMDGESSILFTMKGTMNNETKENPDIHIKTKN